MKEEIKQSFNQVNLNKNDSEMLFSQISQKAKKKTHNRTQMQRYTMKRNVMVAAACTCICIGAAPMAVAAVKWLTPTQVAEDFGDVRLSKAFGTNEADYVTQTSKDYRVVYMGAVTGNNISEQTVADEIDQSMTYAIFAIEKKDGTPLQKSELEDISMSLQFIPLIQGAKPTKYASLFGPRNIDYRSTAKLIDGVYYQITAISDLEIFADRKVYFGGYHLNHFTGESVPTELLDMYQWDESTGEVTRNKNFIETDELTGNYLFELNLDPSKADSVKANQYIKEWQERGVNPREEWFKMVENEDSVTKENDVTQYLDGLECTENGIHYEIKENSSFLIDYLKNDENYLGRFNFDVQVTGEDVESIDYTIKNATFQGREDVTAAELEGLVEGRDYDFCNSKSDVNHSLLEYCWRTKDYKKSDSVGNRDKELWKYSLPKEQYSVKYEKQNAVGKSCIIETELPISVARNLAGMDEWMKVQEELAKKMQNVVVNVTVNRKNGQKIEKQIIFVSTGNHLLEKSTIPQWK